MTILSGTATRKKKKKIRKAKNNSSRDDMLSFYVNFLSTRDLIEQNI